MNRPGVATKVQGQERPLRPKEERRIEQELERESGAFYPDTPRPESKFTTGSLSESIEYPD